MRPSWYSSKETLLDFTTYFYIILLHRSSSILRSQFSQKRHILVPITNIRKNHNLDSKSVQKSRCHLRKAQFHSSFVPFRPFVYSIYLMSLVFLLLIEGVFFCFVFAPSSPPIVLTMQCLLIVVSMCLHFIYQNTMIIIKLYTAILFCTKAQHEIVDYQVR